MDINLPNLDSESITSGLEPYIPDFVKDREAEIELLDDHLKEHNWQEIRSIAHKWQGFSRPYGFLSLEILAKELGTGSKDEDHNKCEQILKQARVYMDRKKAWLIQSGSYATEV